MTRALHSLLIVAVALACAAYWTSSAPARYQASAIIELSDSASGQVDPVARRLVSDEGLQTQLYLLESRSVAERAARYLETSNPPVRASVGQVQANTRAERIPKTRLLSAEFMDGDPDRAAVIANAVAQAFVYRSVEERLLNAQRARAMLEEKMRALTDQIHASDAELAMQVQKTQSALPLKESLELVTEQVKTLSNTLLKLRVRRIEVAAKFNRLSTVVRESATKSYGPELDNTPGLGQLRTEHSLALVHVRELSAAQNADGRAEQAALARVAALVDEIQSVVDGVLRSGRTELDEAQQIERETQAELDKVTATAKALHKLAAEYGPVERDRADAEQVLHALHERANALEQAGAGAASGVRILEPAVAPGHPMAPPYARNLGVGLGVGILLAALWGLAASRLAKKSEITKQASEDAAPAPVSEQQSTPESPPATGT